MKTKTGMSIGLALTLMVGVFATMLALGLFTPTPARAAITGVTVSHSPEYPGAETAVTVEFTTSVDVPATGEIMIAFVNLDPADSPPDGAVVDVGDVSLALAMTLAQ